MSAPANSSYYQAYVDDEVNNLQDRRATFLRVFGAQMAHIALLDLNGVIVETNLSWNRFGIDNGIDSSYRCVGTSYLEVCQAAAERAFPCSQEAYVGLLDIIHNRRPKFTMVYPCHSPAERRWYRMWVEPQLPQVPAIIVAHYLCHTKPAVNLYESTAPMLSAPPVGNCSGATSALLAMDIFADRCRGLYS